MGSSHTLRVRDRGARALLRVPAGRHWRRKRAREVKTVQWLHTFGSSAAVTAPNVRPEPMAAKQSTVVPARVAPRGDRVAAHVL